jgi:hypothetical protein
MRITSGGNVGIGTTSPQAKLTVKGPSDYNLNLGTLGGYSGIYVYNDASSAYKELRIDAAPLILQSFSGGNVGIGTTSPSTILHLNSTTTQLTLQNTNGGTNAERIGMFMTGGDTFKLISLNDNNTTRVDNIIVANVLSGNVGIGTTSPNSLLEVNRTITFSSVDTYGQLVVKTTSGANGKLLNIGVDETNSVSFIQSLNRGTDAMPLSLQRYGGNVGIGTTSPTQKLTIAGSYVRSHSLSEDNTNAGAYFQVKSGSSTVGQSTQFVDNAGNWIIYTGTSSESERMRITSVGNVEINTGSIKTGEPDTGWGRAAIKIGASVSGEAFDVTRYLPVSVDGTVYYINLNSSTP